MSRTSGRWTDALARRPAVGAAAVFIGGILCHDAVVHRPLAWIACALVAATLAAVRFDRPKISCAALAAALFFCAIAGGQAAAFFFAETDIAAYAGDEPRVAKLELQLHKPLRLVGAQFQTARPLPPKQMTTARVTRVLTKSGWIDAAGEILVSIDPPRDDLAIGQRVRVCGMLQRPSPAMNPGQFDWAEYYREQRILTSIQVPHSDAIEIVARARPGLIASAREAVRRALAAGFTDQQSLDHALLRALVLGDGDPELRDVQEQFRRTGTSHHLAISGMHVAMLGFVVYGVCRLLRVRPRATVWIAMVFVAFYGIVALPSPSVVRSVVLCLALAIGILAGRSKDNLQLLAVSVLGMLVYHPLDLYNAGFQLSFGTVLGLMLFGDRALRLLRGVPSDDERAAMSSSKPEPGLKLRVHARRWAIRILAPSLVAWVVSMPLIAFHFQQLNPWAVVGSIVLAPVVFLALMAGFLKIILTALLPMFAGAWATVAAWPVAWMRHVVDSLAAVPGSDVPLPGHSVLFIVIYYALICVPLIPLVAVTTRPWCVRARRLAPACAVLLLLLIPLTGASTAPRDGTLRVTVLAVGAGQCCVIEMPDGTVALLDAGSASMTDPVRRCVQPFLRSRGRWKIDAVWLSHGDYDHTSAADEIVRTFNVPRVLTSTEFDDHAHENPANERLLETIRARRVGVTQLRRDEVVTVANGVTLEALWPPADGRRLSSNDSGLVLKLTYARRTILFPADIEQPAQAALLRRAADRLRCDVMLAPHHGSAEATTAAFVAAADPLYIVSSNDRTLSQKQRDFEKDVGDRPLFRTNRSGAVTIAIDPTGGVTVTPFVTPPR